MHSTVGFRVHGVDSEHIHVDMVTQSYIQT